MVHGKPWNEEKYLPSEANEINRNMAIAWKVGVLVGAPLASVALVPLALGAFGFGVGGVATGIHTQVFSQSFLKLTV